MSLQLLTVGDHPNLAFYAWRLHATRQCVATVVAPSLDPDSPLRISSSHLENAVFSPHRLIQSVSQLDPHSRFDVVVLSVSNLQKFQDVCTSLAPFLHSESLIVVESTGYVALEPFVVSSYPKSRQVTVCSIMNEADVKKFPNSNDFAHTVLNSDQRIYLGTCTNEQKAANKVANSANYARFYKLLQTVQEQSGGCVSLLKSNNYKEFMTYQWKLALPRIVLNPLSVIFEEPFPAELDKQILAKPLISGLVNEIFKIIKKMDCKLIKGFENEANILKNWSAHYPVAKRGAEVEYAHSNSVFYSFYHQIDVDVDLLLLQPILLGDDHGVRTPYLENLYSIVCQLLKMNSGQSIFFSRKSGNSADAKETSALSQSVEALRLEKESLKSLQLERESVEAQYKERQAHMSSLETTLSQRQQAQDALVRKFEEQSRLFERKLADLAQAQAQKESVLADLDGHVYQKQQALGSLKARISQAEATWGQQQVQNDAGNGSEKGTQKDVSGVKSTDQRHVNGVSDNAQNGMDQAHASRDKTFNMQSMQTPDLSEYADVAVYGAALNGDMPQQAPPPPQNSMSEDETQKGPNSGVSDISEKERELQRREQALLARERELKNASQTSMNQNEPYYDSQTGDQFHDSSAGFPQGQQAHVNQPNNGQNMGNGNFNNSGQNYRQSFSLTGGNPYNGQQYDAHYDQRPPHGLPPNGFPQNSLPPTLRNPQRYQQSGPSYGQMQNQPMQNQQMGQNPQMAQRPRVSSHASGPAAVNYSGSGQHMQQNGPQAYQGRSNSMAYIPQQPMNQNQMHQMNQNQMNQNHMNQNQMNQNQMNSGPGSQQQFLQSGFAAKKGNRRSAFPDQALNIDYGGRGGMPMPTAAGNKHKSIVMGGPGVQSSSPVNQAKKTFPNVNQGHLRLPQAPSSNSDSLNSHTSVAEESSKPSTPDSSRDIRIEVPIVENVGKPLGGIAPPPEEKKKKKRSFLKKH